MLPVVLAGEKFAGLVPGAEPVAPFTADAPLAATGCKDAATAGAAGAAFSAVRSSNVSNRAGWEKPR
ncbi:MAG TPA: hypothetical protein VG125_12650 [Pirellulales bacterium]|nr:hypothetical protein [Pirellulales bacterium]